MRRPAITLGPLTLHDTAHLMCLSAEPSGAESPQPPFTHESSCASFTLKLEAAIPSTAISDTQKPCPNSNVQGLQNSSVYALDICKFSKIKGPRMRALILTFISACFLGQAATRAQTCYFPDGSESPRDTPCRAASSGQASACCAYFDICLDNSLCLAQTGNEVITRGTCTDRSWQSGECPRYCQDGTLSTTIVWEKARGFPIVPSLRQDQKYEGLHYTVSKFTPATA